MLYMAYIVFVFTYPQDQSSLSSMKAAEPYIRDGKVCYEIPDGEIYFSGGRHGLKYQRMVNDPGFGKYLGDMAIGVKGNGDLTQSKRLSLSDALGHNVPYRVDNGNLRISQKDVFSLQFPLTLNGEFLIDTTIVYVPAFGRQTNPSVAFDGTNYLVVWMDWRIGWDTDIYGARVDQSGAVIDSFAVSLNQETSLRQHWPTARVINSLLPILDGLVRLMVRLTTQCASGVSSILLPVWRRNQAQGYCLSSLPWSRTTPIRLTLPPLSLTPSPR